jgi:hypothetical protein
MDFLLTVDPISFNLSTVKGSTLGFKTIFSDALFANSSLNIFSGSLIFFSGVFL